MAPPNGWYRKGRDVLENILADAKPPPSVDKAEDIRSYFRELYWKGDLDPHNVVGMRAGLKFRSVAEAYRLIDDDTVPVVAATWDEHAVEIERLLELLKKRPNRANFRTLAPFQVNVFRTELARLSKGLAVPLSEEVELLVWRGGYDPEVGRTSELQRMDDAI